MAREPNEPGQEIGWLSAVRTRGSQEAGRRSRGVEFAPDSPLEGGGFEPSVPLRLGPGGKFQDCRRPPPSRRPCAQLGKSESGYQAPAAVRWVTVSRGGARKGLVNDAETLAH